jgi:heme-degrading monooxygenase HmoA
MAIVVANTITGGTQEMYETVTGKVMPGKQLPEGCQVHIAGPVNEGWRVITVWDSEDAFNQFREGKLVPALREVAGDEAVAPNVETNPAHTVVTA